MKPPEQMDNVSTDNHDELLDALTATVTDVITRLAPLTRLRLLAFMHMMEHPEATTAELEFLPSGMMRLTIANMCAPAERRH